MIEERNDVLPLSGIAVVDAGGATTAYAAKLLWDLGAEVTVLEPTTGHELRRRPPFDHRDTTCSLVFDWYHGAHAVQIVEDEHELADAMAGADVVLVAPGNAPWQDDIADLAPTDAIVCSITPFGTDGPYARLGATHMVSVALAGAVHRYGPPEGPPLAPPAQVHWDVAAAHAALTVAAALLARPWAGGQRLDVTAQEIESTIDYYFERFWVAGARPQARAVTYGIPPTGRWACSDGLVEISAFQQHHWQAFLELVECPDELNEPTLHDMSTRQLLADGLTEVIGRLLSPLRAADVVSRAQAHGLPASVLNTPAAFVADEQLAARRAIVERNVNGRVVRLPASPLRANVRITRDTPGTAVTASEAATPQRSRPANGSGPLRGVRVLSFGAFLAGNCSAAFLAALGADVVKVEAPNRPEVLRQAAFGFDSRIYREPSGVTTTPMFGVLARGARNLALDGRHPEGRAIVERLVQQADVVIENFGTGTAARWGLDFDNVATLNPRVVLLSMSGFGRTGPRAGYLAYAGNISGFTGLTALQAAQPQLSDAATAVHGALGVVAALRQVEQTRQAVHLDIAQIEVMAACLAPALLDPLVNGVDTEPHRNAIPGSTFSGIFPTLGIDAWLAIETVDDAERNQLAVSIGRPDLTLDGPMDSARTTELRDAVEAWASQLTRHSAAQLLQRDGVRAGAVQSIEDVVRDPQLRHRQFPVVLDHPDLGSIEYPGVLHHMTRTPVVATTPAPRLGSATVDVLRDWLGLDGDELGRLGAGGAIFSSDA